ncbi:AMP-binding protein [Salinactinospora qingdaonensis]|uniref:AMP-binding protein n=1 Tax=Salinactinospora qingdaonensis TaxID=702744 RepID=A0ABP7G6V8_9ACTN
MSITSLHTKLAAAPNSRLRFLALDGSLVTKSYADLRADVVGVMSELADCGLGAGDLVGVLGPNSYEWVVADLALLGLECVSVALPAEGRPSAAQLAELVATYHLSALLVTGTGPADVESASAVARIGDRPLKLHKRRHTCEECPSLPADVFSIAFSSGTSGSRKGLLLSKAGVENTIRVSAAAWQVTEDDDMLIVMPFSNFQQRYLTYLAIWFGLDVTVVAPERMFQKLKVLEPTIILGPPSFFEVVYNRVRAAGWRDKLPYYAAALLHAVAPGRISRRARARLGKKWTGMYGSRVRLMFTGSAPVPPGLVKVFHRLGAPLFEVYGTTESGWIAFNLPERYRVATAGRPVEGIAVDIAEDGEIVVASPHHQALGYTFGAEQGQDSVFLPGGKVATGDIGRFDRAGFLRLAGRKKNVIITRSGVKISPEELEHEVTTGCRVTRAMVAPSGPDGLLACVVWLDDAESEERRSEVDSYVKELNRQREPSHRISKVVFRPETELTVDEGLLTRNFKIDRDAVTRKIFSTKDRADR